MIEIPSQERAEKVQTALYRIAASAQMTEDVVGLYKLIHAIIGELMPAENFYIALYDADTDLLSFPYYADEFDSTPEPQKPGHGLTEYVLRSGLPLLATPEIYEQLLMDDEVETIGADSVDWLGVPLKTPAKTIGMMAIQTYTPSIRYSPADQDLLMFISSQVAMVIERKRVEANLRQSEERYRLLVENAPVGIFLANPKGEIVEVNPSTLQILGSPSVEATKAVNILTFPALIEAGFTAHIQQCFATGQPISAECPYTSKWGKSLFIQYDLTPILDADGKVSLVQVLIEDISQRKQSEGRIRKLNRMLQAISQANEALVRATDENELMQRVCQILIDTGGYRLAWIGLARQDASKTVQPVAVAGYNEGYVERANITWAEDERGQGPTGTAIRTGKPVLAVDILTNPQFAVWHQAAMEHGYASSITLPLIAQGKAFGAVNVYAAQADAFDNEEVKLLKEMTDDIAYGITALRELITRQQMEDVLRENEEKYRNVVERANDGIVIIQNEIIIFANQRLAELWGGDVEEIIGTPLINHIPSTINQSLLDNYRARMAGEHVPSTYATQLMTKDESLIDVELNVGIFQHHGKAAELVIVRDITERMQAELLRTQRLEELEAVNKLSIALRTAQNVSQMLPLLLDETLDMIGTQSGAIWLYDSVSGELHNEISRGWFVQLGNYPMRLGEGIGGKVFATGEIHVSSEYAADPYTRESIRHMVPPGWGGVCVPIKTTNETIGIFFVAAELPRVIKLDEVRLLTTLVEIAGNAIHRTRLHTQTELHVQRLSALRIIDMTITASLDLRVTLDVLLEQVISQLGAHAADVLLLNENNQTLEYIIGRGFRSNTSLRTRLRLGEEFAGRVALERRIITAARADIGKNESLRDVSQTFLSKVEEFKIYYGVPLIAKGKVKGVLELYYREQIRSDPEWLDFLETLSSQTAIAIDDAQLFEYLQRMNTELMVAYDSTIEGWSRALELRDRETEGHTRRVAEMTMDLARAMQVFNEENLVHVRRGALLHDIGKMGVPDGILLKPGPLSEEEWGVMRKHPEYAYTLLSPIAYLRLALNIPYCHHEWWNGKGYPRGLLGEQIPLEARIFSVIDVWDALNSDRPYSRAWKREDAKAYILKQSGTQFEPPVVESFMQLLEMGVFDKI